MSMYRQLWLAIVVSTLLAMGGSLLASLLSARGYLESQLSIKNNDNATALALSLSQSSPDPVKVDLVVASLFDRGHYALIRVTDPLGGVMVQRTAPEGDLNAPAWFVRLLPIHAHAGEAQITNGWQQFGTVRLLSHSRFAYGALWKSANQMVLALTLSGLIGGYLASLVLKRLRKPLNAVIEQANAISKRRFVTIAEPVVPELKQLAAAMNATVTRLKSMFEEQASRLEVVRQEANCDALTGLANRSYFLARLRDATAAEDSVGQSVILGRFAHLADVNMKLGRVDTDVAVRAFAGVFGEAQRQHPDALAARLNGADFALLIPGVVDLDAVVHQLLQKLTSVASVFVPGRATTWLGAGNFSRGMEVDAILSQVDAALAAVEAAGHNGVKIVQMQEGDHLPKSGKEWAALIHRALEHRWLRLVSFPVVTPDGRVVHRECPLRLMFDEHGEWLPAGVFWPVAERLGLTSNLDLAAVALGLDELDRQPELPGLAVNLSASSIQLPGFRSDLRKLLLRRAGTSKLWLEVSEAGALAHFDAFSAMCHELRDLGCQLGLEHFGRQFSEVGRLHGLGLDYLKVDASFIRGLDAHVGNQAFLKGLATIAHGIGLKVFAEGVTTHAELAMLPLIGFDGATGPAIRDGV